MHIRLIAVGDRQPKWVGEAFDEYTRRLPGNWRFSLRELPVSRQREPQAAIKDESERIATTLERGERFVLLDERGTHLTSRDFSARLQTWQQDGRDIAFVIGGPAGVSEALRADAEFRLAVSAMTLPHGMARVLLAEQLYRASSLAEGHPYHRD